MGPGKNGAASKRMKAAPLNWFRQQCSLTYSVVSSSPMLPTV